MPAIDLKTLKWTNLFRDIPVYPDLLTQANWDAKKGKIAKMAGTTGIGDQMKKTSAAFEGITGKWVRIQGPRSVDVDLQKQAAVAFIKSGHLKKLHDELKSLRDLAEKTAEKFKKNKLIPSSATKLAQDVREAADLLFVVTNAGTLSGHLEEAIKEDSKERMAKQKKLAVTVLANSKGVPDKIAKAVADWRKVLSALANDSQKFEKARQTVKESMFGRSRDMTQSIANFDKCEKAGVDWENYDSRGIQALVKKLVPYADGTGQDLTGLSATDIEKHIKVIDDARVEFKRLTKDIKIRGT
jgi:hypothetical protein